MDRSAADVRVSPVTADMYAAIAALRVKPGQDAYAGDPALGLRMALDDPLGEAMAVLDGDTVIGFYRLDFSPNAVIGRGTGAPGVGLRAFVIDAAHQGRGIGARAALALCADIARRHPQRRLVLLLVHCRNTAGVATYRRAGFVDSGQLFAGGNAGPQRLMWRQPGATDVGGMGQSAHG
jgi:ribosomal protein S18 acetylase RimI-like enzyme